ncbi:MAG: radical SAM protein [Oligoflexia bacterium]|nr:radical SAM protein [Oligoflexia bacterium]
MKNNSQFIRPCPGSPGQLRCNYFIITPAIGCPYNCSYCFLKAYTDENEVIVYSNTEDMFREFTEYADNRDRTPLRIGSGEFTDSLALPELDEVNTELVRITSKRPWVVFEFKTKSTRIDRFLEIEAPQNIVLSWSLNPRWIIEKEEPGTPGLESRLEAAQRAARHGYKLALHLDPIFMNDKTLGDYTKLIDIIFDYIPASSVYWFSMGGFRYVEGLKLSVMENSPQGKWYLHDEFVHCRDGKFRYPRFVRLAFYNRLGHKIKAIRPDIKLYLCMEDADLWEGISWGNCDVLEKLHPCHKLNVALQK